GDFTRAAVDQREVAVGHALPERMTDGDFTLVHGSPRDPTWEYITTAPVARLNLALLEVPFGLHGHTHLPSVFRDEDGLIEMLSPSDRSTLSLDDRRVLANP